MRIPILVATLLLLLPLASFCQVQINSIQTTVSTCANNGTITVDAVSPASPMVYSIISGPVTAPVQTNHIFNSLPAGTYTVKVTDAAGNSVLQNAVIGGNYLQPDFTPIKKAPYCPGGSDGQLIGNVTAGTGTGPYTWQLIAPSPVTTAPQSNDTFNFLPAGNYTMRLTDACGGFRTIVVTLTDPPATNIYLVTNPGIAIIGCDTAIVNMYIHADVERFPLSITYATDSGLITVPDALILDTADGNPNYFTVRQLLPDFTYSSFLSITITDPCGVVYSPPVFYAQPFNLCPSIGSVFNNCNLNTTAYFDINTWTCMWQNSMPTYAPDSLMYQVTNSSGVIVAADTVYGYADNYGNSYLSGFGIPELPTNETYTINISEPCGRTNTQTFYLPDPFAPTPTIDGIYMYPDACMDSAGIAYVDVKNFRSQPYLVMLSGPTGMGSTKPGYEYSATYTYPDTIPVSGFGWMTYRFDISHLAVGTYHFKVVDTCGFTIYDSLTVDSAHVTDFRHHFWYKKGCLGQNELHWTIKASTGHMRIRNISSGLQYDKDYATADFFNPLTDSLLNLPSGTYVLRFEFQEAFGSWTPLSHTPVDCQVLTDTVVIEGYATPAIFANNYIQCQGGIHVELIPDSSKGVPPYQYEIISGPQTFPVQSSNVFDLIAAGTYTVRIYDICGNGSTAQVTVDPINFPPVTIMPFNCNSTSLSFGSSQYYTYQWIAPNGTIYNGDTLTIDPVTPADTGTYHIIKIVNINGCIDTFYSTHHISLLNTTVYNVGICNGSSVTFGTHVYNSTGVYTDTLLNINNCDSIVVLNLTVGLFKRDSITRFICPGQSFTSGGHAYTQTGIYHDTLSTATCDSIITLNLTVMPLITHSIVHSICANESFTVGSHVYTQTGIYHDTLSTATCDSIVTLSLTVIPLITHSISQSICAGGIFTVGTHNYSQTGIYHDTLTTSTCDSIVILNLTVLPSITHNITQSICTGNNYTVGTHVYNQTGIYHDTLTTATCDSIVVLNLTVISPITHSITQSICTGTSYSVGTHVYNQTGIYHDTLSTAGCDSILVLNLTVIPLITNSITQSICAGTSYTVGTHVYNQTGIYHDTLSTSGCDSIVVLNLTVIPLSTNNITQSICAGTSYTVGIHVYNQTGIYHDTLATATCDSIIILNLTVLPLITHSITQSICTGTSYTVGTHVYNQTGIYHDTLSTAGCDSIVILNLTALSPIIHYLTQSVCAGNSYTVGTHTYNQTGIYHDTLTTATCDSIVILNLTVLLPITHSITQSICTGTNYTVGTHMYNQTGIYHDTLTTATCDSIVILNLTVLPPITHTITQSICAGSVFHVGIHMYNQTGIYHDTLNTAGCDSIVILNLTVLSPITHSLTQSICSGNSYIVGTHVYNQTGIYHDTLSTAGCDSMVILNLTVLPPITHSITQSICAGTSYTFGTHVYNQTGIYHDTLSTSGCDSIVSLHLFVTPLAQHIIADSICGGQVYIFNGHTYTQSGTYTDTLHTGGCDSIAILHLLVIPLSSVQITASAHTVIPGDIVQLSSTQSAAYLWTTTAGASLNNPVIQNPTAVINHSSWIYLNTTNAGLCASGDSVFIVVNKDSTPCSGVYIYMPSAFTPNRDGRNDVYKILSNKVNLTFFQVYNRWGEQVFQTNDMSKGWDGTYKGSIIPGAYVYMISYYVACDSKQKLMKGSFVLIR